jgi:Tol biopolymer transport system component
MRRALLLPFVVLLLNACDQDPAGPEGEPTLTVSPSRLDMHVGEDIEVGATLRDVRGDEVVATEFAWTSSSPDVASVDAEGLVIARGAGAATITVSAEGLAADVAVSVSERPAPGVAHVAFLMARPSSLGFDHRQLRIVATHESKNIALTPEDQEVAHFAWAPEGSAIVAVLIRVNAVLGRSGMFVIEADGTGERELTGLPGGAQEPDWSANGRIAFRNSLGFGESDLYTIRADGTDLRRITAESGDHLQPRWSPDGQRILYVRATDDVRQLMVVNADGTGRTVVSPSPAFGARWSPDGTRIAYDDGTYVWIVNADGSGLRSLIPTCAGVCASKPFVFPEWSPDGRKVAFSSSANVHIMNVDSSREITILAGGSRTDPTVSWDPDGSRIFYQGTETHPQSILWAYVDGTGATPVPSGVRARFLKVRP